MAKITRIKAKDDRSHTKDVAMATQKANEEAKTAEAPIRKVSVKAKGSENPKVRKSKLEEQAEREMKLRERSQAEKNAIEAEYSAKRNNAKTEYKKAKAAAKNKKAKKLAKKDYKKQLHAIKLDKRNEHPGYFRGAVREIQQVRWPNRKETWKLTWAVIGYIAFVFICLMLLDALLKFLFNKIIGGNM